MALSPMMQQFLEVKEQHKDALLFFRVGDFYELYFDDAVTAARELDIILTGRDCGLEKRVPMAGVPFHSVDPYIARLTNKGYKVAIAEQIEAPINANKKGALFTREVIRTITPGTTIDEQSLKSEKNNYIASVFLKDDGVGIVWSDISTGEFNHSFLCYPYSLSLSELLTKIEPAEIICNQQMSNEAKELSIVKFSLVCDFYVFEEGFKLENAKSLITQQFTSTKTACLEKQQHTIIAAAALIRYLDKTQKRKLSHISSANAVSFSDSMYIDSSARKNLELCENATDKQKRGSLLWVIDKTKTKAGARLLRKTVLAPLTCLQTIKKRQDAVEELLSSDIIREKIIGVLKKMCDIERIVAKVAYQSISPKEMLALANSLELVKDIKKELGQLKAPALTAINNFLLDLSDIYALINRAIVENPPSHTRDGGIFKKGYNANLDQQLSLQSSASQIISELEASERAETGLKNLKISYTRNFGYYIEVSRALSQGVPFRYIRRQTLKAAERYTTEELQILEKKILAANSAALQIEQDLYLGLIEMLNEKSEQLLSLSSALSSLDVLCSFSCCAKENSFTKPTMGQNKLIITDGRHPIIERLLQSKKFVPNDTLLDENENRIKLITGPNMAGKSVYMRSVALITILAHMGSFVPATRASIPIIDKIFTRVGASDDSLTGRSTFMVEMTEVSNILENITDSSLVLLDEVGRGTSTFDGMAIALSLLEYLLKNTNAKILFSTHYHELTDLEERFSGIKNYKLSLKEIDGSIVFLRKLLRGKSNKSFGIEVAGLAGIPSEILLRAKEVLSGLEKTKNIKAPQNSEIHRIIKDIDLDSTSPRLALEILSDLKEKLEP